MNNPVKRLLRCGLGLIGLATMASLFTGCAGYKLGSMLPDDIKTVYVPAIINRTTEPLIEIQATQALLRELQTDGSLRVVDFDEADAVLEVRLRSFRLRALRYTQEDRSRPEEFSALLTASVKLIRTGTGEVIVQEPAVYGDFFVPFASDLTSAKRLAMPDVTRDLAHDIVERVVEAWPEPPPGQSTGSWVPPGSQNQSAPERRRTLPVSP